MSKSKLSITESSDFQYLLELLPVLKCRPEYACLPELFSIIGHDKLIKLCTYAGGETVMIPTLDELSDNLEALDFYYKVYIEKSMDYFKTPVRFRGQIKRIKEVIDARNNKI